MNTEGLNSILGTYMVEGERTEKRKKGAAIIYKIYNSTIGFCGSFKTKKGKL